MKGIELMQLRTRILCVVIAPLLIGACSSSSKSSGSSTASTAAPVSKDPIRIALMTISQGANATPGADNPFKVAVDEVNAAGGIMGRRVEFQQFNTDITPQGASTATSLAVQYKPDVFVGYGVSAGLKASISQIIGAGVPVIHNALAKLATPESLGTQLSFRLQPTVAQFAGAADRFLFQDKGVKSLMVINTQDSAPTAGAATILAEAKTANVKTDHRAVPPTVTDLTEPLLATKSLGADAIWSWGYPTTDGLLVKTAAANGFSGKIMSFGAGTAASSGLIPPTLLNEHIYAISPNCAPALIDTPAAKQYTAAYKAKFDNEPTTSVANENYDAVYIFKAAVEKAKSTDGKAVGAALATTDHAGVCGQEKADANHNLEHSVFLVNFPGGKATLAKLVADVESPY